MHQGRNKIITGFSMCPQNAHANQHALTSAGNFIPGSKPRGSGWVWLSSLQFRVTFVGTTCIPFNRESRSQPHWPGGERQLECKAHWAGRDIFIVDRFAPTSKTCSACGLYQSEMPLRIREWVCPDCATRHNRDINAAKARGAAKTPRAAV